MKLFNKLVTAATTLSMTAAMLFTFSGVASAACYQYSSNGMITSNTPVFNNICNVPNGIGNESDFVRIRPNTTGDPTSTSNNAAYTDSLNSACNNGDKFDIHTYIHNDATPDQNGNGSGSAVAHNVQLAMNAALGTTASNFTFGSTVSASNAASVHDTATLNCGNGQVKLSLVPSTVKVYGTQYNWTGLPDSAVNGTTKIGSPIIGSGDVWGCWEYRVVVVYSVVVEKVTQPTTPTYMCNALSVVAGDKRTVSINGLSTSAANGAVFKNAVIDWGDNSATLTITEANGQTHQYKNDGTYTITATAHFTVDGKDVTATSANCAKQVTFTSGQPPVVTPPTTPQTPSTLVNTGAGSVAGIFAAATAAGAVAYRYMLARRLSRQ